MKSLRVTVAGGEPRSLVYKADGDGSTVVVTNAEGSAVLLGGADLDGDNGYRLPVGGTLVTDLGGRDALYALAPLSDITLDVLITRG